MKRYPEYKESGVEWIGEIPTHWKIRKNKYIFNERSDRSVTGTEELLTVSHITGVSPRAEKNVSMFLAETLEGYKHCSVGNLVINTMWAWMGALGISEFDGIVSPSYNVYQLKDGECLPRYYHYLYRTPSYVDEIIRWSKGIWHSRLRLYPDAFFSMSTITPPLREQTQIANFLDRKTEQIDELIRIKERMVELLQEQRTALVHETVTKGLDPNVEMKPSGVEWIGEIPVHWEVKRLKYVAKILSSIVDKHIYPDEIQVRLCNYTDVYNNDYITIDTILEKGSCKESEFTRFVLQKDDVIITKDSETPDDIGVPTYVKDDLDNVVCGYHLTMIRPFACRGEFIFRFIQSDLTRRYFEFNANGITRYGLRNSIVENLFVPIPTDSEQTQIANFLDHKTAKIDELRSNEQRSLELLKEYRHTLISEVVTGKLDVRSEV